MINMTDMTEKTITAYWKIPESIHKRLKIQAAQNSKTLFEIAMEKLAK